MTIRVKISPKASLRMAFVFGLIGLCYQSAGAEDLGFQESPSMLADLPGGSVTLTLRDEVDFRAEPLLLSQVTECVGDEVYCQDAKGIDLGQKAAPGKTIVLAAEAIKKILALEWPKADVKIVGKPFTKLRCSSLLINNDEISEALTHTLEERVKGNKNLRVTIERVQMTNPLLAMDEEHEISFPIFQDYVDKTANDLLRALIANPTIAGIYRSKRGPVRFFAQTTLRVEEQVHLAKNFITMGAALDSGQFSKQWYAWSAIRNHNQFASDVTPYVGQTIKRGIPAGEPLPLDAIARPIVVQRGQTIQVVSHSDVMDVSIRALAQGSGIVGQTIEAEVVSTKKKVAARVIDSTSAELIR